MREESIYPRVVNERFRFGHEKEKGPPENWGGPPLPHGHAAWGKGTPPPPPLSRLAPLQAAMHADWGIPRCRDERLRRGSPPAVAPNLQLAAEAVGFYS